MQAIREYLISVITAAIFCGVLCTLFKEKTTTSSIIKVLCGVFLCVSMLQPLTRLEPKLSLTFTEIPISEANILVEEGYAQAKQEQIERIQKQCTTYISEKARQLACEIEVEVTLEDDAPYTPCSVILKGAVSPYAKAQLSNWIQENMGVPTEEQTWIG